MGKIIIEFDDENEARKLIHIIDTALKSIGLPIAPECTQISGKIMNAIQQSKKTPPTNP